MWGGVVQGGQIVLKTTCHHVQVDSPVEEKPKRGDRFGHGVRVGVYRLNSDQGTEPFGVFDNDLCGEPRIHQGVVCVDEKPLTSVVLTPSSHVDHVLAVHFSGCPARLGTRGENLYLWLN